MAQEPDAEFDALLRSLVVSPDEAAQHEALKERIRAQVAPLFEEKTRLKTSTNFARGSAKHTAMIFNFSS